MCSTSKGVIGNNVVFFDNMYLCRGNIIMYYLHIAFGFLLILMEHIFMERKK